MAGSGSSKEQQRLLALMEEALEQDDPHAWIVLQQLDAPVEAQALSLVKAHREAALLIRTAVDLAPLSPIRLPAGTMVGSYRLGELVGSGGMADVYRAERADGEFEQVVAIKIMRRALGSTRMQTMFHNERQILARLSHVNIARLYDGGTTHGLPYVVMELLHGVPIDRYVQSQAMGQADVLRMVAKVCDGVQHAHQSLVVHRDIKPSNILVTADGTPKLLDFGIAQMTTQTAAGSDGALTPAYASPEQLAGLPVTTATDVYSLGKLLSHLLSDMPLPASVHAVVARASAQQPEHRYATAGELADDLRRFLKQRPVTARRPTWGYRVGLFLRRNWLACSAVTLVCGTAIAGVAGVINQAEQTAREAARLTEVTRFLTDMLGAANPAERGRDVTVVDLLRLAEQRIITDFSEDPLVRAALFDTLSVTFQGLGDAEKARDYARRSLALYQDAEPSETPSTAHARYLLANALTDLSAWDASDAQLTISDAELSKDEATHWRQLDQNLSVRAANAEGRGDLDLAEQLYRRSLALSEKHAGDKALSTAVSLNNLAVLHTTNGRYSDAISALRRGLSITAGRLPAEHPDRLKLLSNLATALDFQGARDEAAALYEEVIDIQKRALGIAHRTTLITMGSYALMTTESGAHERGLAVAAEAFAEARQHLPATDHVLGYVALAYGQLQCLSGTADQGVATTQLAVDIRTQTMGPDSWATASASSVLGACLAAADRLSEAQETLRSALAVLRAQLGEDHFHTATARARLANVEQRMASL